MAAMALELCILTAARSGEILGMRWAEVDLDNKLWTVPADRMKAGREHRVPLSARAIAILKKLNEVRQGEFVFPGQKPSKPLSNMAMDKNGRAVLDVDNLHVKADACGGDVTIRSYGYLRASTESSHTSFAIYGDPIKI